MRPLSYAGYRFPPEIIQHAIWLYLRFTLSFRDVEELLAERGIDVSHETIRRWVAVFGPMIARRLRAMRPKPHTTWHLDEMFADGTDDRKRVCSEECGILGLSLGRLKPLHRAFWRPGLP